MFVHSKYICVGVAKHQQKHRNKYCTKLNGMKIGNIGREPMKIYYEPSKNSIWTPQVT